MLRLLRLLLPALLPSWRFFQTVEPSPRVEWRAPGGRWRALCPTPARLTLAQHLARLFWNPARAEALYLVSLSERLFGEDAARIEALLQVRAADLLAPEQSGPFELRVVFVQHDTREVLYTSGVLEPRP
jgi:hypothetical protein